MGVGLDKPIFTPEFYRELAQENPLGLKLHWREAEAWFLFIAWPSYKTYNYTRHRQTVRRWWSKISMRDLERAHVAMDNMRIETAQVEQDLLQRPDDIEGTANLPTLHRIFGGKRD